MRIEHIALYTTDIDRSQRFYQEYFAAVPGERYHNPKTGLRTCFLTFSDGARLELMTLPELEEPNLQSPRTGWAHIAFSVGSREMVDKLTSRLRSGGYEVVSGPRVTGDGYYESCVLDPGGSRVEITV